MTLNSQKKITLNNVFVSKTERKSYFIDKDNTIYSIRMETIASQDVIPFCPDGVVAVSLIASEDEVGNKTLTFYYTLLNENILEAISRKYCLVPLIDIENIEFLTFPHDR